MKVINVMEWVLEGLVPKDRAVAVSRYNFTTTGVSIPILSNDRCKNNIDLLLEWTASNAADGDQGDYAMHHFNLGAGLINKDIRNICESTPAHITPEELEVGMTVGGISFALTIIAERLRAKDYGIALEGDLDAGRYWVDKPRDHALQFTKWI